MNFTWNKKESIINSELLRKTRVPILILDKVWHNIFPPEKKTKKLLVLEEKLFNLLKEQGQLNNDFKDYLKLKKKFMDEIMKLTTEAFTNENESAKSEMEKNQKNILEVNKQLEKIQNKLKKIPDEIEEANGRLLQESVKICYEEMKEHQRVSDELNEWIDQTRAILKKKLEEKTVHDEKAIEIYSYLHDLIGPELIEYLDSDYWR